MWRAIYISAEGRAGGGGECISLHFLACLYIYILICANFVRDVRLGNLYFRIPLTLQTRYCFQCVVTDIIIICLPVIIVYLSPISLCFLCSFIVHLCWCV